ncbi:MULTISPECIES: hypothetical protein [unclassified Chelatococcus]|uniref:hypothetical protein n=1 Tax=unclassified Chelatococcus TaxID=2638111 RepID=UPI001BCE4D4F|nr:MULTISPECIES: hypothetical protein [unclassified Chelatococcus]MBS7696217.1 hypothetical protein [Chelatococcus sp. YT9]MBX3557756.1 hypothetical protein [Chelatococcus sp.]
MVEGWSADKPRKPPPLFGVEGNDAIDAKTLEHEIKAAAASIRSVLDENGAKGAVPFNFGIATALYGMWVKDGQESQYTTHLQTFDQFGSVVQDYEAQGFAPIDFMGSGRMFEPWTVLVAPKPRAGYYVLSTTNADDFCKKDTELFESGFRIVSFNYRHGRSFNATWRGGGGGAQWIHWDMSYFDLLSWNAHYRSEGLRIAAIDRYGNGGALYAAVWQPGDGEQIIEAPGGQNIYFGQPARLNVYRYRNRGLHVRAMGHNGYPIVVFRPTDSQAAPEWFASSPSNFKARNDWMREQGFRLDTVGHASWQFG